MRRRRGRTRPVDAWFWWYQAKIGELVVCRNPGDVGRAVLHDDRIAIGTERERGVIDRVPRDVMNSYLDLVSTTTRQA